MKTKKEIIEELKETAEQCKNKSNIEMLLKIAEICEKVSDDSRMHEATELEWRQYLMITNTMRCRNDRKIRNAKIVLMSMELRERQAEKSKRNSARL